MHGPCPDTVGLSRRSGRYLVAAVLVLAFLSVLTGPARAAEDSGVTAQPGDVPVVPTGALTGVSCATADACVAVGTTVDPMAARRGFAQRWDGVAWSLLRVQRPRTAVATTLAGVSCASRARCTAVGTVTGTDGTTRPFATAFNGSSWSARAVPLPAGAESGALASVSCVNASACVAVGSTAAGGPLAVRWNGTAWRLMSPRGTGALSGVSCTSRSFCAAVGATTQVWNGNRWSATSTPAPSGAQDPRLVGVSCVSAAACQAVGSYGEQSDPFDPVVDRALTVAWNGVRWSLQQSPAPATGGVRLRAVSCATAGACVAVGTADPGTGGPETTAYTQVRSGRTWTARAAAAPGSDSTALAAVSCTSAGRCRAVGAATLQPDIGVHAVDRPLIQRWNGATWSLQSAQSPVGASESFLQGVSCVSATTCVAVGASAGPDGNNRILTESWDGATWTVRPAPTPAGSDRYAALRDVSCVTASTCIAVGQSLSDTAGGATLAEAWDGTHWTILATPALPGATDPTLDSVSCTSATSCVAVGSYQDGARVVALVEQWDGSTWTVLPTPALADAPFSFLSSVSCSSATQCVAVGTTTTADFGDRPLAELWDGTSWTVSEPPVPDGRDAATLTGVSCTAGGVCTAVGQSRSGSAFDSFAARWDGTAWTLEAVPGPAAPDQLVLRSVSCIDAGACAAAGAVSDGGPFSPASVTRDGTHWTPVDVRVAPRTVHADLNDVSCTAGGTCVLVGSAEVAGADGLEVPTTVVLTTPTGAASLTTG